jgi:hypothetical protein
LPCVAGLRCSKRAALELTWTGGSYSIAQLHSAFINTSLQAGAKHEKAKKRFNGFFFGQRVIAVPNAENGGRR